MSHLRALQRVYGPDMLGALSAAFDLARSLLDTKDDDERRTLALTIFRFFDQGERNPARLSELARSELAGRECSATGQADRLCHGAFVEHRVENGERAVVETVSRMISVVQRGWLFEIELTLPGRSTPYPLRQMFASQEEAIAWLKGYEGRREIARIALIYRSEPLPVVVPQSSSTFDLKDHALRKARH